MSFQETGIFSQIYTFYVKSFIKSYQFWIKCCKEDSNSIFKKVHSAIEKGENIIDETVTAIEDDIKDVVGSVFEKESKIQTVFQKYLGFIISTYKFNIVLLMLIIFGSVYFFKKIQAKFEEVNNKQFQSYQVVSSETDSTQVGGKNEKNINKNEELTSRMKEIVHKLAGADSATAHVTPQLTPEVRTFETTSLKSDNQKKNLDTSSICSAPETSKTESLIPISPSLQVNCSKNSLQDTTIKKKISLNINGKNNKKKKKEISNRLDDVFKDIDKNCQEIETPINKFFEKSKTSNPSNNPGKQSEIFLNELEEPTFDDAIKEHKIMENSSNKEVQMYNVLGRKDLYQNKLPILCNSNNLPIEGKKTSPKDDVYVFPTLQKSGNDTGVSKIQKTKESELLLDKTQPSENAEVLQNINLKSVDDSTSTISLILPTVNLQRGPKNSTFEALIKDISFN